MMRSQLKWQCRRGMRELDVLLTRFLEAHYDGCGESDKAAFQGLLALSDPDLVRYLLQGEPPDDQRLAGLVDRIRRGDRP
jgi:antitoxin CptB